jgi:UDP-2,4-diacetamido-2,4,6-trideoxy-beta-L-altropyranose hydrolase
MEAREIHVRRARQDDCERILEWRNHPSTRLYFFNPEPIDADIHRAWFAAVLADTRHRHLLIAEDGTGSPIGVVRFDEDGDSAWVDIYLVPERHGRGLGKAMLDAALQWLASNSSVNRVHADVLAENAVSMRMFSAAGFVNTSCRFSLNLSRS